MDCNVEEKLETESLKLQEFYVKTIADLTTRITDRNGVFFLKKLLLKQSMQNYFSSDEQLLILHSDNPNELVKLLSEKSKWFDGNFLTIVYKYFSDAGLEKAEQILFDNLCDQICSLVTDFNRIKHTEKEGEVWIIDPELQKLLGGAEDERKLHHFCAGVLKKPVAEFKTESTRKNSSRLSDPQIPLQPIQEDNIAHIKSDKCCSPVLVEAAH